MFPKCYLILLTDISYMIYIKVSDIMNEYKVTFFYNPDTGKIPVQEYLDGVSVK